MQNSCACGEPQAVRNLIGWIGHVGMIAFLVGGVVLVVGIALIWSGVFDGIAARLFPGTDRDDDPGEAEPSDGPAFFAWREAGDQASGEDAVSGRTAPGRSRSR
ncbi:hypothetical protein [Yinghuangia soli]|uniref:Uncharacterized protein n=1 Tax=Yinghuangia soli TaxID=2908204 RepID=A0AA41Q8W4_9ACTN|nr:hypothetical protein [Yinghuangia soli]MCF2533764.1 hypothetical protein [Yinghuangia soli]